MPKKSSVAAEIQLIRTVLQQLQYSLDRLASEIAPSPATPKGPRPRRKMHISPARRAALKLQGRYLGYMRVLKPRQKSQVKKIRLAKGIRAAIAAARKLAS